MNNDYVLYRAPLRIGFLGGGTDLPHVYARNGGLTISAAINFYVYTSIKNLHPIHKINYRLSYSETENVNNICEIKNDIIRTILLQMNVDGPISVNTQGDLPSFSGMGYSSAFCVSMIAATYEFLNKRVNKAEVADLACNTEINLLKKPIGKQDQYASAFGGFNITKYEQNSSVKISGISLHSDFAMSLERSMILIWTGVARSADTILQDVAEKQNVNREAFNKIFELSEYFEKKFYSGAGITVEEFGALITESWESKKQTSNLILPIELKLIEDKIRKYPFWGWKLLGAGGGGFFLALGSESCIADFLSNEKDHITLFPKFDPEGLKCLLNQRARSE